MRATVHRTRTASVASPVGATHSIHIPRWHPVGLNRLLRLHWRARQRALQGDADMVAVYALLAGVPRATGKRRVTLELTLAGRDKRRDADNVWKSVLDALVKCGALMDDSPEWVECGPVTQVRGEERATTIVLEGV